MLLISISIVMIFIDARQQWLQPLRSGLAYATQPIVYAATLPARTGNWLVDKMRTEGDVRQALKIVERENLILRANLQKLESIEAENSRLQRLLSASGPRSENAVLAELVDVSLEPLTHRIITNRGIRSGVFVGQAVIDTNGIMGQVTGVTPFTSVVTLITDPNHAIPVQIRRNGLRAIVYGIGIHDQVNVPYMTPQTDIKPKDVLVSSGMGGRFPAGYPVAKVVDVVADPNEPFLIVRAAPIARLDYTREVLLIRPGDSSAIVVESPEETTPAASSELSLVQSSSDDDGASPVDPTGEDASIPATVTRTERVEGAASTDAEQ